MLKLLPKLIAVICLISLLYSCERKQQSSYTDYLKDVTDYAFELQRCSFDDLLKNGHSLYNSINNTPTDSNGVYLFEYQGEHYYHPVKLCYMSLEAMNDYDLTDDEIYLEHAITTMEALREHAVRHEDKLYFPYQFAFDDGGSHIYTPPWFSGMAQGTALSAYSRIYHFTQDEHFTAVADSILRTFIDFESEYSGVEVCEPDTLFGAGDYYWVDEYPQGPKRFVLNGSIIGAMGLYDHWWVWGDDLSRQLFSYELSTVKDKVSLYRVPKEMSLYDLYYRNQFENYHLVHRQLLHKCTLVTGDPYFSMMADLMYEDYH
jgi:hypothetical protein